MLRGSSRCVRGSDIAKNNKEMVPRKQLEEAFAEAAAVIAEALRKPSRTWGLRQAVLKGINDTAHLFKAFVMAHILIGERTLEGAPKWFEVSRVQILANISCEFMRFKVNSESEREGVKVGVLQIAWKGFWQKRQKCIDPLQLCRSSCYSCQGRHLCAATACGACSITVGTCTGSGEQTFAFEMRRNDCASKFVEKVEHSWHFWALHAIVQSWYCNLCYTILHLFLKYYI